MQKVHNQAEKEADDNSYSSFMDNVNLRSCHTYMLMLKEWAYHGVSNDQDQDASQHKWKFFQSLTQHLMIN